MRSVALVAPVVILFALLRYIPLPSLCRGSGYFNGIVFEFLFGIVVAQMARRWWRMNSAVAAGLVVAGFGVLFGVRWWLIGEWHLLAWGVPALAIVVGALGMECRAGARAPRWLLALGDASSYSIYLVHTFVLPVIGAELRRVGARGMGVVPAAMVLSVCASAGAGWVVYRMVELPMMRWFKGRRRTAVPVV